MEQYKRDFIQYLATGIIRNIAKVFWLFPIRRKKIFCMSFAGNDYSCNPKYLTEYLLNKYDGQYQIIWAVKDPLKYKVDGVTFVKFLSIRHFYHFCTSGIIIDNGGMPTYLPKRKNQYFVNTWHGGGAYKKLNPESSKFKAALQIYKAKCTDLVLSSSRVFTEIALPTIVYNYQGEILSCGMPRNDMFFSLEKDKRKIKVCKSLGIDEKDFIVLYAPTYRGIEKRYGKSGSAVGRNVSIELDVNGLQRAIEQRFERETTVLFRKHYLTNQESIPEGVIDVSLYPDVQELIAAADIIVSDYSSIIWDYSLLKRPCFLFVPDISDYLDERGVYTPIQMWPGIIAKTNQELCNKIISFDEVSYAKSIEKYLDDMGSYETGTACEQVCKRIAEVCGIEEE